MTAAQKTPEAPAPAINELGKWIVFPRIRVQLIGSRPIPRVRQQGLISMNAYYMDSPAS